MDFLGPILGGFPVELLQKFSGEKIAFAAQQLCTKIRFRCVVVLEKKRVQKLDGSLPANPVNDRRIANAVTLKSTFCLR